MLDKTIVISNLRRFLVRVSSNSNINVRNSGGASNGGNDNNEASEALNQQPNVRLDPPNKVHFRGGVDDVTSGDDEANISNVMSSANLVSFEEKERRKNIRGLRRLSERISLSSAPTDLPLPAAHHRIQSCIGSWFSGLIRIPILLGLLYFFVCSLDFLSTAFRLIAGKTAGNELHLLSKIISYNLGSTLESILNNLVIIS